MLSIILKGIPIRASPFIFGRKGLEVELRNLRRDDGAKIPPLAALGRDDNTIDTGQLTIDNGQNPMQFCFRSCNGAPFAIQ